MNCACDPPKHAVVRVVQKLGPTCGREFFTCPTSTCKFFSWVGASMPMSIQGNSFRGGFNNSKSSRSNFNKGNDQSPQKTKGRYDAKIGIHEVVNGPPVEIWLSLQCPSSDVVNDLFARLPVGKCNFSSSLKMWLFSIDVIDRIMEEFLTTPFENFRLPDLPKFLAKGLATYKKKINRLDLPADPVVNLDAGVLGMLLPFQLEAVKFVIRHGGRALLADDMGKY